jgi:hypothetical protein
MWLLDDGISFGYYADMLLNEVEISAYGENSNYKAFIFCHNIKNITPNSLKKILYRFLGYVNNYKVIKEELLNLLNIINDNQLSVLREIIIQVADYYPHLVDDLKTSVILKSTSYLLIKNIIEQISLEHDKLYGLVEIKELHPEPQHTRLFSKAEEKFQKNLNDKATEKSFLRNLFPSVVIKAGTGTIYAINETIQVREFAKISVNNYKNRLMIYDIVGLEMQLLSFRYHK